MTRYHTYVGAKRVEPAQDVPGQPIAHDSDGNCAILGLRETVLRIMMGRNEVHIVAVFLQGKGRIDDQPLRAADTKIGMQKCDTRHRARG